MMRSQPATEDVGPINASSLIAQLRQLREARRGRPRARVKTKRHSLTRAERAAVAAKTDGRCHICGGVLGPPGRLTMFSPIALEAAIS